MGILLGLEPLVRGSKTCSEYRQAEFPNIHFTGPSPLVFSNYTWSRKKVNGSNLLGTSPPFMKVVKGGLARMCLKKNAMVRLFDAGNCSCASFCLPSSEASANLAYCKFGNMSGLVMLDWMDAPMGYSWICGHKSCPWLPRDWHGSCYVGVPVPVITCMTARKVGDVLTISHPTGRRGKRSPEKVAVSPLDMFFRGLLPLYGTVPNAHEVNKLFHLLSKWIALKREGWDPFAALTSIFVAWGATVFHWLIYGEVILLVVMAAVVCVRKICAEAVDLTLNMALVMGNVGARVVPNATVDGQYMSDFPDLFPISDYLEDEGLLQASAPPLDVESGEPVQVMIHTACTKCPKKGFCYWCRKGWKKVISICTMLTP